MRVLIVYESLYGTNRMIARMIADGIGPDADVTITEARSAPSAIGDEVDLIVVGGPNHHTGLPTRESRAEAVEEDSGKTQSASVGLREWLSGLSLANRGQPVAVWDTRMARPRILVLLDHSSRVIAKELKRAGARLVCKPQTFYSADGIGAIVAGEEERARTWGTRLVSLMTGLD